VHQKLTNGTKTKLRRTRKRPSNRAKAGLPAEPEDRIEAMAREGKLRGAGKQAVARLQAKGIPVTFARGNRIIKRHADGTEEVLGTIN
jgi:hypothetical protein